MWIYVVITALVIIVIYVSISCRNYFKYYYKRFSSEFKYKKSVSDSLKVDLKTRKLSNEEINKTIEYLNENLPKIGYKYKGEFVVPDDLRRELVYAKYDEKRLRKLFKLITAHMGITDEGVEFEIKNVPNSFNKKYAGLYNEQTETTAKKISMFIAPDFSYETVLSVFIHEATHHFLLSNGIRLEDRTKNEYLTDITTVYTGFGKYMLDGYKQNKKLVFLGEYKRTTSTYKVGYLNYSDIKYTINKLKSARKCK